MDTLKVQFSVFVFLCFVVLFANVAAERSKYIDWIVAATPIWLLETKESLEFVYKC